MRHLSPILVRRPAHAKAARRSRRCAGRGAARRRITPPRHRSFSTLTRWDAAAFSDSRIRPALVASARGSCARRARERRARAPTMTSGRRWRGSISRGRSSTRSAGAAIRPRRPAPSWTSASRRSPASATSRRASTTYRAGLDASWELDLFGRVRAAVARGVGERRQLRGRARERARQRRRRRRAQLLRAARHPAAAVGARSQPRQPARDAAADEVRRDAGIGEEQDVASASARVSAIEAGVPPLRTALAAREHRLAVLTGRARPAGRRSGAARLPGARQVDRARSAGPAAAPAARRARGRTASRRDRRHGGRCRGRPLSAHHHLGRARPAGRPRQPVRHRPTRGRGP